MKSDSKGCLNVKHEAKLLQHSKLHDSTEQFLTFNFAMSASILPGEVPGYLENSE